MEEIFNELRKTLELCPAIVLGSGASIPYGYPSMYELGESLIASIKPSQNDQNSWNEFVSVMQSENDLEKSLQLVTLSAGLVKQIVEHTFSLVANADKNLFQRVLQDMDVIALQRMFRFLLSSTRNNINVITTNYDLIAEFAANAAGFAEHSGFSYGYIGRDHSQWNSINSSSNVSMKTVQIWKVHGSSDWFMRMEDQEVLRLPQIHSVPSGYVPLIVTPGIGKYAQTHEEPYRSILSRADKALLDAAAYFCYGYGFNDSHIQPKLVQGISVTKKPIIVLSRTLSENAKALLFSGKVTNFVAIEKEGNGSKIFNSKNTSGLSYPDGSLWKLDEFMSKLTLH